ARNYKNPSYVAVGASGAVSGIVFSYILFFPMSMVGFFFIPMPAFLFAFLYLGLSVWGMKSKMGNIGHVSCTEIG
ncbi:MAG: rhomboid family intramembrane serine protease, partial [Ignavibacteriae bacterium]|nr:rhomboid family intramembrane serine protease [Ignavibacteriota bacterium]